MAWCNTYTRLLLRKKNRNYQLFKKYNCDYQNILNKDNPRPEVVTRLLDKKNKAYTKAREAANESCKANRRAKAAFHMAVNNTLRNPSLVRTMNFGSLRWGWWTSLGPFFGIRYLS